MNSYKHIKAVFFDVGNTLLFFNLRRVQTCLRENGYRVPLEKLHFAEGRSKEKVDALVLEKSALLNDRHRAILYYKEMLNHLAQISDGELLSIARQLRRMDKTEGLWNAMMPGTKQVLRALKKQGYVLGVISNSDGRVGRLLDENKLTPFFEIIVDSAKLGIEKPDPRIFHHACSALQIQPRHAIYVGDFYSIDVLGAKSAGLNPILLQPRPYYSHPRCKTIRALAEIPSILQSSLLYKTSQKKYDGKNSC